MNHSVKRRRQALHQTHHHYYLNISVEAANLSDWRIESKLFCPNWNALIYSACLLLWNLISWNFGSLLNMAELVSVSDNIASIHTFNLLDSANCGAYDEGRASPAGVQGHVTSCSGR